MTMMKQMNDFQLLLDNAVVQLKCDPVCVNTCSAAALTIDTKAACLSTCNCYTLPAPVVTPQPIPVAPVPAPPAPVVDPNVAPVAPVAPEVIPPVVDPNAAPVAPIVEPEVPVVAPAVDPAVTPVAAPDAIPAPVIATPASEQLIGGPAVVLD